MELPLGSGPRARARNMLSRHARVAVSTARGQPGNNVTSLWRAARPRNRNLQTSTRPLTARLSTQRGRDDHRSPPEPIDPAGALLSPVDNRAWVKNTVPCRWTQQVVQYSSHLRQSSSKSLRPRGGRCSPSRRARPPDARRTTRGSSQARRNPAARQAPLELEVWKRARGRARRRRSVATRHRSLLPGRRCLPWESRARARADSAGFLFLPA
jgi:hypothetical protein